MLCACWLYRSYRLVGRSRIGARRRNHLSPPPAITHQILGHGGSHFEPKDSVSVERILPLARKLNHGFLLRRQGIWGSRDLFFILQSPNSQPCEVQFLAYRPLRSRSRLKIAIMLMAFRSIDCLRTIFFAIISLNTVLDVNNLNFS